MTAGQIQPAIQFRLSRHRAVQERGVKHLEGRAERCYSDARQFENVSLRPAGGQHAKRRSQIRFDRMKVQRSQDMMQAYGIHAVWCNAYD
jgi:hypothetical protein